MKIGTDNSILISQARNGNHKPYDLIRELVDNCIDGHSSVIDIIMKQGLFQITDNGNGIVQGRMIESFTKVGKPLSHSVADIGKYNIGMKISLIALGDTAIIETKAISEDPYMITFDWTNIDNDFSFENTEMTSHGTRITVHKPFIKTGDTGKTKEVISKTYKWLIESGLIIKFNGEPVEPSVDIPWIDKMEIDGDGYRLVFGTYDTKNKGVYNYREIDYVTTWYKNRRVSYGLRYDSINDIDGNYSIQLFITNGEKYHVSPLKDHVIEAEEIIADHSSEIREFIKPNIEKGREVGINSMLNDLAEKLGRKMGLGQGRKTAKKKNNGAVLPKCTDIKRINWQNGDSATNKHNLTNKLSKLDIRFKSTDGVGYIEESNDTLIVYLDNNKPEVDIMFKPSYNEEAVTLLCCFLIANSVYKHRLFPDEDASIAVYKMIHGVLGL